MHMKSRMTLMLIAMCGQETGLVMAASPDTKPAVPVTEKPSTTQTGSSEFPGILWEGFRLNPELALSATRDDNIYSRPTGEVEDNVSTLAAALDIRSDWTRHELNFSLGGDFGRYQDQSSEDVDNYWVGTDGAFQLNEQAELFGGLMHTRDHEDRSVPGTPGPLLQKEPTQYEQDAAHLGLATSMDRFLLRFGGTYDQFDYENATAINGATIDNKDRDYWIGSVGMRLGYQLSPVYEAFVQYADERRRYETRINNETYNRDSDGYRAAVGLRFTPLNKRLAGEVFAGNMHQTFDYAGFNDIDKPYFGGVVRWKPSAPVKVTGFVDRVMEETTVRNLTSVAAASVDTTYGVEVERELSSRLSVYARASNTQSEYQSFDQDDRTIDAGGGLRYYVSPTVFLGGDLRVIDRDSNVNEQEYRRSQVTFSIGFTPGRDSNYRSVADSAGSSLFALGGMPAAGLFSGPYVGGAIGYGLLNLTTSGEKGDEGSDYSPLGDADTGEVLFAGYGQQWDRWYLGAEIEATDSQVDVSFSKQKDTARTISTEQNSGYGLSLRGGYIVDNGSLLYLRAGAVRSEFDTYYTINNEPDGAFKKSTDQDGFRYGVGADIPASERLFVRMEYDYTRYDDKTGTYSLDGAPTSVKLEPRESQFRVGLGWLLGDKAQSAPTRPEVSGFYAGIHAGHGSVDSNLKGRHSQSGEPLFSQAYNGQFAGMGGVFGAFAGYGMSYNRWYAGLEAEVDTNSINWQHKRDTAQPGGGRDFSADKKSDYGVALRLGYSLPNGTLLYGRGGPVKGRFNTTWSKGENILANIDRSYEVDGTRYGIGAEIPLSENTFARLDYTRTDYDSYQFTTSHGAPDQMKFENS